MYHSGVIFAAIILPIIFAQKMGPAKIDVKSIEKCADPVPGINVDITMKDLNETHKGFDVTSDIDQDFDEQVQLIAVVNKWNEDTQDWGDRIFDINDGYACMFYMRHLGEKFMKILKSLGQPESCPLKKGTYEVKDYPFDGKVNIHMVYGKYKLVTTYKKKDVVMLCLSYIVDIGPQ